jgi:hypothetical protein
MAQLHLGIRIKTESATTHMAAAQRRGLPNKGLPHLGCLSRSMQTVDFSAIVRGNRQNLHDSNDSPTWCRTAAVVSAARRLRVDVSKNSSTALSSNEGELERSTIT